MFDSNINLQKLNINVQEILDALYQPEEAYTIFLSGSVIEGYGNVESDLDVFVVYPQEIPPQIETDYQLSTNSILMEFTSQWRLDIEYWSKLQIENIASRFLQCSFEDKSTCFNIPWNDFDLAHRIRIGLPITNPTHFQHISNTFNFEHVSQIIMAKQMLFLNSALEDAAGAIVSKQHGTALLKARQAVQLAIDILLAAHGETNITEKWRFFKLEKLGDANLLERYWALELPNITNRDAVLGYAKECLNFANQLVLQAQKKKH